MSNSSKVLNMNNKKSQSSGREVVRRNELIDVMEQVSSNIRDISGYLMQDMNTMFSKHLYPTMINLQATLEVLCEKNFITKEEVDARAKKIQADAIAKAKEVKENPESHTWEPSGDNGQPNSEEVPQNKEDVPKFED